MNINVKCCIGQKICMSILKKVYSLVLRYSKLNCDLKTIKQGELHMIRLHEHQTRLKYVKKM